MERMRAIAEAEEIIKPYVGKLAMAQDSAEGVYSAALKMMQVDTRGVHPSALKAILLAQPKPGTNARSHIAEDSAAGNTGKIFDIFPGLARAV